MPNLFKLAQQSNIINIKSIQMGNKQSNDDFSKNPNFDINRHREAMQHLSSNYVPVDLTINQPNQAHRPPIEKSQFKRVNRTCSIYKPSFNIHPSADGFHLEFDYDSQQGSKLQIYGGVIDITEDNTSKVTVHINSKLFLQEMLPSAKKARFSKDFPTNGFTALQASTLIIRIMSPHNGQITEYSLRKIKTPNHWKVLLQKLELGGVVTELQNIYKAQQGNECIICLTDPANTLIEPCNHLCLCNGCSESVRKSTNKCPICRKGINNLKIICSNT